MVSWPMSWDTFAVLMLVALCIYIFKTSIWHVCVDVIDVYTFLNINFVLKFTWNSKMQNTFHVYIHFGTFGVRTVYTIDLARRDAYAPSDPWMRPGSCLTAGTSWSGRGATVCMQWLPLRQDTKRKKSSSNPSSQPLSLCNHIATSRCKTLLEIIRRNFQEQLGNKTWFQQLLRKRRVLLAGRKDKWLHVLLIYIPFAFCMLELRVVVYSCMGPALRTSLQYGI